ncbi:DNA methyltransferase [Cytophagales bacterium WSM2-2]|nr:DNA methyltransferase [Cytophagales bacterium WSM2-2]
MNTEIKYLIIDLFCGAGGTTLGFESAMSRDPKVKLAKVIACVNHDHLAIRSHWANHPDVEHFEEDIRHLDPYGRLHRLVEIYRAFYPSAKLILWASLECTNFSKAKGGLPRDADSRTLADHLYKYILALNPDFIQIENVVEFMSWGPLDEKGKPVSRKNGQDWLRWREKIRSFGYHDDWRELNAADFGALTSRNRLFGCFARTGVPITWPEPTHTKKPEKTMISRPLKKWRPVKEALDFSDEGRSIFNRPKRLSSKTMQRLFMGCVKHIAGGKDKFLTKFYSGKPEYKSASIDDPSPSVTTFGGGGLVKAVFLQPYNSNKPIEKGGGNDGLSIENPAPTIGTRNTPAIAFISRYNGVNGGKHDNSHSIEGPVGALGCGDNHAKVTAHFLANYYSEGGQHSSIEKPCPTIPTKDRISKIQAEYFVDKQYNGDHNHQSIHQPAGTILTNDKHQLVKAETFIDQRNGSGEDRSRSIDEPSKSLTSTGGNLQIINAKFIANGNPHNTSTHSIEEPSPTLLASRHHHYIINPTWFNEDGARSIDEPCFVIIARQDKAPLYLITCKEGPIFIPVYEGDCEWTIKLKEFMALYNICDIKMRMLKVSELKVIQGFPISYILHGNQTEQKKFIGNAVEKNVPKSMIEAMEERDLRMAA